MICKICKKSGKQGQIFVVNDFEPIDKAICSECYTKDPMCCGRSMQAFFGKKYDGWMCTNCGECQPRYCVVCKNEYVACTCLGDGKD